MGNLLISISITEVLTVMSERLRLQYKYCLLSLKEALHAKFLPSSFKVEASQLFNFSANPILSLSSSTSFNFSSPHKQSHKVIHFFIIQFLNKFVICLPYIVNSFEEYIPQINPNMHKQNICQEIDSQEQAKSHIPSSQKFKFLNEITNRHKNLQKTIDIKKEIQYIKSQNVIKNSSKFMTRKYVEFDENSTYVSLQKKVVYINGNKINGAWKNNILHGQVIIEYKTGEYFEGIYANGERTEGKLRPQDGAEYVGGFKDDLFHGNGMLIDAYHRIISCQWKQGKPAEKVTIQYPSGDVYYGEVRKLKKHGEGHLFFKNGSKYVGKFEDGQITGEGCFYENDVKIAQGIWKDGILQINSSIKEILCETFKTIKKITLSDIESVMETYKESHMATNRRKGIRQYMSINMKIQQK